MNNFQIVNVDEAKEMAASGDYVVVDLRGSKEYEKYHLENAISIPFGTIENIQKLNRKNEPWLVYCERGNLSFQLASKMARRGYLVYAVRGFVE